MAVSLQRERVAEDAGARKAAGKGPDEIDGIDVDALAVDTLTELAARRAFEHELERLPVDRCPLTDDVGDEPSVVVGCDVHVAAGGLADVDAMSPQIAGEADVEEILEAHPADRRTERDREVPHRRWRPPTTLDGA